MRYYYKFEQQTKTYNSLTLNFKGLGWEGIPLRSWKYNHEVRILNDNRASQEHMNVEQVRKCSFVLTSSRQDHWSQLSLEQELLAHLTNEVFSTKLLKD